MGIMKKNGIEVEVMNVTVKLDNCEFITNRDNFDTEQEYLQALAKEKEETANMFSKNVYIIGVDDEITKDHDSLCKLILGKLEEITGYEIDDFWYRFRE